MSKLVDITFSSERAVETPEIRRRHGSLDLDLLAAVSRHDGPRNLDGRSDRSIDRLVRLERLIELDAPETTIRHEMRMLRAAVDQQFEDADVAEMISLLGPAMLANYLDYIAETPPPSLPSNNTGGSPGVVVSLPNSTKGQVT